MKMIAVFTPKFATTEETNKWYLMPRLTRLDEGNGGKLQFRVHTEGFPAQGPKPLCAKPQALSPNPRFLYTSPAASWQRYA
jgi:hypothetical protein